MKKFLVFLGLILILSGCGKYGKEELIDDLKSKIDKSDSYHMTATLEIYRNEEIYKYDVDSSYKKDDLFRVSLINQNNNHEQIILKNEEGVYVLTPSLNKSFKFQSEWPYNNSQIYLLQPILTDIKNDSDSKFEETKDGYTITNKVNYSTEKDFIKQKVYIDKEANITKVEVLDSEDEVKMSLKIIDIDYDTTFDENYFSAKDYEEKSTPKESISEKDEEQKNEENKEQQTDTNSNNEVSKIEEIVYPMYVPTDTYLAGQDVVNTTSGERVILTFTGESAFTIVQETANDSQTVNYIYGDPYLILDTVGALTDYSVSWISNGVEYSVMSDTMSVDELLSVAQSISVKAVGK